MNVKTLGVQFGLSVVLVGLLAGCETLGPTPAEVSEANVAMQYMRHDIERLKARSEESQEHQHRLHARLDQASREMAQQHQNLRQELDAFRRELAQIQADRERLREAIVADLSERMSRLLAAQATSPRAVADRAETGYEHVVEAGQTLSEIARAYGVTVDAILKANNMTNPDRIRQGQTLFIPE